MIELVLEGDLISEDIEMLKKQLEAKDEKLKNQANELNHLTNTVVPNLKKENKKLKALKAELTDALEQSTKKYFDQLDINADLSESVAKKGAGLQLAQVRLEEIEKLVAQLEAEGIDKEDEAPSIAEVPEEDKAIVKELEAKVKDLEKELANKDKEISKKSSQIKSKDAEISDLNENLIPKLKAESANLKKELKEVKAEFDESESNVRGRIVKLEANIKDLEGKLDNKTRDYNKLSTTINNKDKEIKSLKNRNKELSESLDAESSKGFFAKLTGR